jgi:cell wall-associated NlpC family hydrolase
MRIGGALGNVGDVIGKITKLVDQLKDVVGGADKGGGRPPAAASAPTGAPGWDGKSSFDAAGGAKGKDGMPALDGGPQRAPGAQGAQAPGDSGKALDVARSLIGRGYGDINSGTPVGRDSPNMNCAQFVNAVYPDLPSGAPRLHAMATPGDASSAKPGDVLTSTQPGPYGHVGIMTERNTVIHSIPGRGVHESSLAAFQASSPVEGVIHR